ncbi:MAG: RNHCP domain-containing protein [Deinococcales bacterium]
MKMSHEAKRFTAKGTNEAFLCANCGANVPELHNGSYRNHCPFCLYSLHVDIFPGDRDNDCGGLLRPTGVEHSTKKGWVILYECDRCGAKGRNKAALDDVVADDFDLIIALSRG